jgi:hypothetical protein
MADRICVVLTANELEMVVNAVNYERHNNDLTDDYRVDLENLEQYLTGQQEGV